MAVQSGPDAREHPRAKARIRVEFNYGATIGAGYTTDISEGGIFVVCHKIAQPGVRVYLRLHLPGSRAGDPLKIIGKVARSTERFGIVHDASQGMGIQFEVAYARTREALHHFIHDLLMQSGTDEIEAVPGSHPGAPTFGVRLAPSAEPRARLLNVDEVSQAFSFDASNAGRDARWDKMGVLTWRIAVGMLLVAVVAYFVARLTGVLR